MKQQGIEQAMDIRTLQQAEEANVGSQAIATSLRSSGVGVTESNLTVDTRAVRLSTTGSLANDEFLESDTGWRYRWDGTKWAFVSGLYAASDAARTSLTISAEDNGAWFFNTDTDADMGLWQVSAGSWVKRFPNASVDLSTGYKVAGVKVVGAQGAAIADVAAADATDLATAITLVNELKSKFGTSLARDRAHGLIAT